MIRRALVLGMVLSGASLLGQVKDDPMPTEGLWPSDKLMKLMLERWGNELGQQFALTPEQQERATKDLVARWSQFLKENRSRLQPLFNEFIEMRMELRPPAKDRIQEWSHRAVPVFEDVQEQMNLSTGEFRNVLNPTQRLAFEAEVFKFQAGMIWAGNRLKQWKQGEISERDFWEPTRAARRDQQSESKQQVELGAAASARPKDPIADELHAWEKYVKEFIVHNGLDEGQRTTALSCLAELSERALAHRNRHREAIDALEVEIKKSGKTDGDIASIEVRLTELYGPVDRMFEELTQRMESILTESQRTKAAHEGEKARRIKTPAVESKSPE